MILFNIFYMIKYIKNSNLLYRIKYIRKYHIFFIIMFTIFAH